MYHRLADDRSEVGEVRAAVFLFCDLVVLIALMSASHRSKWIHSSLKAEIKKKKKSVEHTDVYENHHISYFVYR